jgi:hypothetical protein
MYVDDDESSTDKDVSCDSGRYGAVVDQLMHRCCELAAYKCVYFCLFT